MWSQGKQLFCAAEKDGFVELAMEVRKPGRYRLRVLATAAPDFGTIRMALDGKWAGAEIRPVLRSRLAVGDPGVGQLRPSRRASTASASQCGKKHGFRRLFLRDRRHRPSAPLAVTRIIRFGRGRGETVGETVGWAELASPTRFDAEFGDSFHSAPPYVCGICWDSPTKLRLGPSAHPIPLQVFLQRKPSISSVCRGSFPRPESQTGRPPDRVELPVCPATLLDKRRFFSVFRRSNPTISAVQFAKGS